MIRRIDERVSGAASGAVFRMGMVRRVGGMARCLVFSGVAVLLVAVGVEVLARAVEVAPSGGGSGDGAVPGPVRWGLGESADPVVMHGSAGSAAGVSGGCLVLGGDTVVELKESASRTGGSFSVSLWFNPYELEGGQQMLAGKNRYALNERQWSLTIEPDGRLKAYVQQGGWVTIGCAEPLKRGSWHWAVLTVGEGRAALFLNGKPVGEAGLARPVASTAAPVMLGGIWDAGRTRQGFTGALDECAIYPRALDAGEVASAYRPVAATHEIPVSLVAPVPLWDEAVPLPKSAGLSQVEGVEFHVLKKPRPDTDECRFTLGVGLAWHRGRLYASYAYNRGEENTPTEEAHVRVSEDGGRSWSPTVVMDAGADDLAVSHGVFLSEGGRLWAFMGAFRAHARLYHQVHARAYSLNESSGAWEPHGEVVGGGFWPMQEPQRMPDGNWIMAGLHIGGQFGEGGNHPAVAISKGADFTRWEQVVIPAAPALGEIWGESAVVVEGRRILNISRYGRKARALVSVSEDCGRTWTPAAPSNLPMATSKPYAGILSTGQRYLVCTTTADTGGARSPLTIAVSRPGEAVFSRVFLIRRSIHPGVAGVSAANADFSYPYAVENGGRLYIGYTHKSHSANEVAVVPVAALEVKP